MPNRIFVEVACPNCRTPIDVREHDRHISCDACGSHFLLQGHLCPQCHTYHTTDAVFCRTCNTALKRTCGKCRTTNWAGDEYCIQCGEAMDIFEFMKLRNNATAMEFHSNQVDQIRRLKQVENEASEQRMQELMMLEQARLEELERRLQQQKAQERKMLLLAIGMVSIFLILVIVYAVINSLV